MHSKQIDKQECVRIISQTFETNPSVNIVIGEGGNRTKKLQRLAAYAYVKANNRNGVYFSENRKGVALCFDSVIGKSSIDEFYHELKFAFAIPLSKVMGSLKRETYIKKHRLQERHLYFWFFGVEKGADRAGFELKNELFDRSNRQQLPLILETSVPRNKVIYERYGFEVYHEWQDSGDGHTLWFMKRMPDNIQS